jgi:SAM-dependent methyltransferase
MMTSKDQPSAGGKLNLGQLVSEKSAVQFSIPVQEHLDFLADGIFQVRTKWPHFQRMLDDLVELAAQVRPEQRVVCLERAYVYGGDSLFAPLFTKGEFVSVDCHLQSTAERAGYQKSWLEDPRCIHIPATLQAQITQIPLPDHSADILLVPNVVHHVQDQEAMFAEIARLLKPGGTGYIFEALLRELHQAPDDYVRYTPWGFETMLKKHGLRQTEWRPAGGPFEAISYCWVQALQYLPPEERAEKEAWFYDVHLPELLALDRKYPDNLSRQHTTFPVGYGVFFTKP